MRLGIYWDMGTESPKRNAFALGFPLPPDTIVF